MDEQQLLSMLRAFVLQKSAPASKPWMSYGGINNSAPVTLLQQVQSQIQGLMTSMLGPLGGLAAPYVSQFIAGTDFNKNGTLNNSLSGLLAPSAGTYANAWQNMRSTQQLRMLKNPRQKLQDNLRRDFYQSYYSMTMGLDRGDKRVKDQTDSAMQNVVSVPAALQFIFDPAKNQRIMQGIKNTQAGFLYWQDRMNPFQAGPNSKNLNYINWDGTGTQKIDRVQAANRIGTKISDMAKQANRWQLGAGKGSYKDSFGGFTGAQVSQLASILANSANTFDPSNLQQSINQFQDKIKATAQALAPLKDIFGKDIKAMTDMLQSMSGQSISQLSPTMINSMATSTVDMARYSGATVTQIAQAGQKLFMQTAQLGGNTFSRIGGGMTGAYYTGLIAQGNAPAGVHAAQYAGSSQRALASAQASSGVDWTAMAYGIWQEKRQAQNEVRRKNGQALLDTSEDAFMAQVRQRRSQGGTMMDAVRSVAEVKSQQQLLRGLNTLGYRTSLQSGKLAQLGIQAQYHTQLADAIGALRVSNTGIDRNQWTALGKYLSNDANAAAIKQLAANSNNKEVVEAFAKRAGVSAAAVNRFVNTGNMQQYMARWASSIQINNYKRSQQEIREATKELDAQGAGGLLAMWRAASDRTKFDEETGTLTIGQDKKGASVSVGKFAIQAQMRALFGESDIKKLPEKIQQLGKALGGDKKMAAQVLALAGGQFGSDDQFTASIRTLNDSKASTTQKAAAKGYIMARRNGFLGQNTKFTSKEGLAAKQQAYTNYEKAAKGTQKQKQNAREALRNDLDKALRIQNLSKMSGAQLGVQGADRIRQRREALIKGISERGTKRIQELLKLDEGKYNEAVEGTSLSGISKADLQRAYSSSGINYSNVDVNRIMVTLMQQLLDWFRNNPKEKK